MLSKFEVTGHGNTGSAYTLTSSSHVDVGDEVQFVINLDPTVDKLFVDSLLNKDSAEADDDTVYNLKALDNWAVFGAENEPTLKNIIPITVSNYVAPTVTSVVYDHGVGTITVNGQYFTSIPGSNNDIDATKLTFTGDKGYTWPLTSGVTNNVDVTSSTQFIITVAGNDKLHLNGMMNVGSSSATADDATTTFNVALADINFLQEHHQLWIFLMIL